MVLLTTWEGLGRGDKTQCGCGWVAGLFVVSASCVARVNADVTTELTVRLKCTLCIYVCNVYRF